MVIIDFFKNIIYNTKKGESNMNNLTLEQLMIVLRLELEKITDGFDAEDANKKSNLTLKMKTLFLLSLHKELTPTMLIENLGLAKSNLTILCRSLLEEGLVTVRKSETDKRTITYILTNKGEKQLKNYLNQIKIDNINLFKSEKGVKSLEKKIGEILKLLNKR